MLHERLTMLVQRRAIAEAAINALLARRQRQQIPPDAFPDRPPPAEPVETWTEHLETQAPAVRSAREEVRRSELALQLAEQEY